jgi:hypothetical protein
MNDAAWAELCDALPLALSVDELEDELVSNPALTEDDRAALWLYAWSARGPGSSAPGS